MSDYPAWEEAEGMVPGPRAQTAMLPDTNYEDQLPSQDDVDAGYEAAVKECAADRLKMLPALAMLVNHDLPSTLAAIQETARELTEHDGGDWHDDHGDWTRDGDIVLEQIAKAQEHIRIATALMRPHLPETLAWPPLNMYGYAYAVHVWQYEDLHTEHGPYGNVQTAVDTLTSLDRFDPEDGWEAAVVYCHTSQTRWQRVPDSWLPEESLEKKPGAKQHG